MNQFTADDCEVALNNAQTLAFDCESATAELSQKAKAERAVNCEIIRVLTQALTKAQNALTHYQTKSP